MKISVSLTQFVVLVSLLGLNYAQTNILLGTPTTYPTGYPTDYPTRFPGYPIPTPIPTPLPTPTPTPTPTPSSGSNPYILKFAYAARQGVPLETSQAQIYWNGALVGTITPKDYSMNIFYVSLTAVSGNNNLTLVGTGTSDGYGLLVTSMVLTATGSNVNLIVNGDFSTPNQGTGWTTLPGITGWSASEI